MRNLVLIILVMALFSACGAEKNPETGGTPPLQTKGTQTGHKLIPYLKGKLYGYASLDRKIVIEPQFEMAELFENGIASVKKDGMWGAIKPNGEYAVPPKFYNRFPLKFNRGLAYVDVGGNAGYINTKGDFVIPPTYFSSPHIGRNYWPVVRFGDKYGLFNLEGKKITNWDFDFIWDYQDGMAMFRVNKEGEQLPKYGFLDTLGKIAVPAIYNNVSQFSEGLAWVRKDEKYGTIDKKGNEVMPPTFPFGSEYKEGLASNSLDQTNWGYVDKEGNVVIDYQYQSALHFVDGWARVMMAQQWGVINKKGEFIHPCNLQDIGDFYEGLATIMKDGKFGYVNKDFEQVIPMKYSGAKNFEKGIAQVMVGHDNRWFYIDKEGNEFREGE